MEKFDSKPFCEGAVKVALQFGKTFSYKTEDINDMEEILEQYHNAYESKKITDEAAERLAICFGIYLGQIMLESKLSEFGYEWRVDENQPCLASDDNNKMYPVSKVYKRIINGIEDDVKSFYDVAIAIAERGFLKK